MIVRSPFLLINVLILLPNKLLASQVQQQEFVEQQQQQDIKVQAIVDPTCSAEDANGGSCVNPNAGVDTNNNNNGNHTGQNANEDEMCHDEHENCARWAKVGECQKNSPYMLRYCRRSCDSCSSDNNNNKFDEMCQDLHDSCAKWAKDGECQNNSRYMMHYCRRSCESCPSVNESNNNVREAMPDDVDRGSDLGVPQKVESENVAKLIAAARDYMSSEELESWELAQEVLDECRNQHESCAFWAVHGECENNPTFMKKECAPICQSCEYLTVWGRCPLDPDATEALEPGDLNKLFERLVSEPYLTEYNVQIVSSPFGKNPGPWLITMDNVIKDDEADRLIEMGNIVGFQESTTVGEELANGTLTKNRQSSRTSMNSWCLNECYQDPLAQRVIHRLSNITGIDERNSEYLQLLRYEEGQHYDTHHDYIEMNLERQQGVRILTFYLYLNDVEEGGGTNFDKINNVTLMPKRGRAALWPSVLDEDPNEKDPRTTHKAMPVINGVKYGANAWFHLRDFKTPYSTQCI